MSETSGGGRDSHSGEDQRERSDAPVPDGDAYSRHRRGLDLLGRGSAGAAIQLMPRASEAEPGSHRVLKALGRAQFDADHYVAAADGFRQIVATSPSDDYAHFGLGLAQMRDGNPAVAAEHLALPTAMRPELPHCTGARRSPPATLRVRSVPSPGRLPSDRPGHGR